MLPIECVVRGYLTGSGWKDYRATGATSRPPAARGLAGVGAAARSRSSRRRRRRRRATTRTSTATQAAELVGAELLDEVERDLRSSSTRSASEHAAARGIILADTKLEFGLDEDGRLVLGDEAFTPDSSRFWPADEYEPGRAQPSFDKQFVRDYCETLGWDKTAPGPELPDEVVAGHARALRRGVRAPDRDLVRRRTSPTPRSCSR